MSLQHSIMKERDVQPAPAPPPLGRGVLARDSVLVRIRHDLRTPLNGILGYARHLIGDPALQPRHRSALAAIEQCGMQLQSLVDDIADLAQLHVGSLAMHEECVDLAKAIEDAVDSVRTLAEGKQLRVVQLGAAGLPRFVATDGKRVRQLLSRLLAYAVRNAQGQGLTMRTRAQEASVRFEILDREVGLGAPTKAGTDEVPAPGEEQEDIGLSLARGLIECLGGKLHERSGGSSGAWFWFELSLASWHGGATREFVPGSPKGYEGPRRRILVVDDVLQNCALVADALGPLGFDVEIACDGRDGLERARNLAPDLVVTDIVMPVLDGLESARRMRQVPALARVPIVAVTANAGLEERKRCEEAGIDTFLPKPVDIDALIEVIGRKLGLHWIQEPASASAGEEPAIGAPAHATFESDESLAFPPAEFVERLHEAARRGSMREIREFAGMLENMEPRYLALAQRLRALADGFQTKGILALVERHRDRPGKVT